MSRSRKKTPFIGWASCNAGAMSWFRSMSWGRERAAVRDLLIAEKWDLMPHPQRYGNEWESPRDGKCYMGEDKWAEHKDCNLRWGFCPKCSYEEAMRK